MGQVSKAFFVIGLILFLPAFILTIVSVVQPAFFWSMPWINSLVIAIITVVLYVAAFAFIILGIVVAKRDLE